MEYMSHVLELISRAEHAHAQRLGLGPAAPPPTHTHTEYHCNNCVNTHRTPWST
jgi:hypothetical protein